MTSDKKPSKTVAKKAAPKEVAVVAQDDSTIDSRLMSMVGSKSTTEIARELGMAPHEVKSRINTLLDSIDILTIQQQRSKMMISLNDIVSKATKRLDDIGGQIQDREYAAVLNASTSAINVHLRELARMEKADDTQITQLNDLRIRELIRLLDRVVISSVDEIVETHDLDYDEVMQVFQDRLLEESASMDLNA